MTAQNQKGESSPKSVKLAEFRIVGPGKAGKPIPVHFNPETLEYTVTNNIKEGGNSTKPKQQVSKTSGKLTMELVFDTTLDGTDVRAKTDKLQALMQPTKEGKKKIAPVVEFAWGTYRFKGIFTSYKETLDYFSSTGVPLRASISVTMTQQDGLFDPQASKEKAKVNEAPAFSPVKPSQGGDDENRGPATGDPQADRALGEDNGEDNLRFFSGRELSLPVGPDLLPPVAFASPGSGGLSLGLDVGLDVGFSVGLSAGLGIGLGIEAGIDVGLSAGFDIDIGIDLQLDVAIDVGVGVSAGVPGATGGRPASSGTPSGAGALTTSGGAVRDGSQPVPPGAAGGGAATGPGARSAAFGDASLPTGFPGGPIRTRGPRTGPVAPGDELYEGLPLGPRFGGPASAGVSAAAGAFAGLRSGAPRRRRPISLASLQGGRPERELRTDAGASFELGGQALDRSPSGLGADVGARATLADRLDFDDSTEER